MSLEMVDVPGVNHACNFCGTLRHNRRFLFVNEARSMLICDSCVEVLAKKLTELNMMGGIDVTARPN